MKVRFILILTIMLLIRCKHYSEEDKEKIKFSEFYLELLLNTPMFKMEYEEGYQKYIASNLNGTPMGEAIIFIVDKCLLNDIEEIIKNSGKKIVSYYCIRIGKLSLLPEIKFEHDFTEKWYLPIGIKKEDDLLKIYLEPPGLYWSKKGVLNYLNRKLNNGNNKKLYDKLKEEWKM